MRYWIVVVLLAFAGCTGNSGDKDDIDDLDDGLEATSTTGVIRGVVVNEAIVPVEGVAIQLLDSKRTTATNAEGNFGFDKLEPGTYFLNVAHAGFLPVQQSVGVEAGVDRPPIVRILMQADEDFKAPRFELITYEGFYQCGTSAVLVCGLPNNLVGSGTTDDTSAPTIHFPGGEQMIQTEMVWDSTQAASTEMYFEMEAFDAGCSGNPEFLGNAEGDTPIRARLGAEILAKAQVGEDCGIYYSVFAGDVTDGVVPPWGVGFSIEQKFTWFITAFYGYEPPEDWWFVEDGTYPPP